MFFVKLKRKIAKHKKLFNFCSKIKLFIVSLYYRSFMILFSVMPIKQNKIVVVSYSGKGYGDNGKYIVEELKKNENLDIYWAAKKKYKDSIPDKIKYVKMDSIRYLYHLSTAQVWINNSRFVYGIRKRKGQFYIQTWHSSLRLKKIEKDAIETLNPQYVKTCIRDSKMIDIIISGAKFSTNTYKNSFWYDGEVLECGTPRSDLFFNKRNVEELKQKISERYNIDLNKKIILYAPTFRKNTDESEGYIDVEKMTKYLNNECNFLVRFHPISKYEIHNDSVINVTDYSDMQELISISDILITDYSGCCFDMLINDKPCILFVKDIDNYLKYERNLYFDFEELPFPKVKEEKELYNMLANFDAENYCENAEKFKDNIGLAEHGTASETIANLVIEKCIGGKNEKI